jgi:hypothetical protein
MIGEFIKSLRDKTAAWFGWQRARDARTDYVNARRYVAAFERKDREEADRIAAGFNVSWRLRNEPEPALKHCINLIHRRVYGGGSDSSVGGCYRTMSKREFAGSIHEQRADAHYETLINGGERRASGMP